MADYKPTGTVTTTPKKMTFWQKQKKRWWLHLINFVLGTILISMLLNYVMLPAIAQSDVNKSELHMESQEVTNPRPDAVHIKMKNKIINKSLFTPQLDKFNASLFLENTEPDIKPFGYLQIPGVHATKVAFSEIEQELEIVDKEQFIAYNKLVTSSETFRVAVRGRTKLHLGALPVVTVNFNKAIEMKGLNGLKGIRVEDVELSLSHFDDGSNMHGFVVIPNPSVMTIEIGDMLQDLYADGKLIGNTTMKGVTLKPGDNRIPVTSITDQTKVIPLVGPGKKFPTGILEIEARTVSVTNKGQPLDYFTEAMKASPVHFKMDIGGPLRKLGLGSLIDGPGAKTGGGSTGGMTSTTSTTKVES